MCDKKDEERTTENKILTEILNEIRTSNNETRKYNTKIADLTNRLINLTDKLNNLTLGLLGLTAVMAIVAFGSILLDHLVLVNHPQTDLVIILIILVAMVLTVRTFIKIRKKSK